MDKIIYWHKRINQFYIFKNLDARVLHNHPKVQAGINWKMNAQGFKYKINKKKVR